LLTAACLCKACLASAVPSQYARPPIEVLPPRAEPSREPTLKTVSRSSPSCAPCCHRSHTPCRACSNLCPTCRPCCRWSCSKPKPGGIEMPSFVESCWPVTPLGCLSLCASPKLCAVQPAVPRLYRTAIAPCCQARAPSANENCWFRSAAEAMHRAPAEVSCATPA